MRASEWRITWDPAGESPRVLLDHGDTMEDEIARSLSQVVGVGKFDFLSSGRPASRGNMKQRLEFTRRIEHADAAASWHECSAQIAAAPWGETGKLKIEPRNGSARTYIAALISSSHRPVIDGPQPESLHEYAFRVRSAALVPIGEPVPVIGGSYNPETGVITITVPNPEDFPPGTTVEINQVPGIPSGQYTVTGNTGGVVSIQGEGEDNLPEPYQFDPIVLGCEGYTTWNSYFAARFRIRVIIPPGWEHEGDGGNNIVPVGNSTYIYRSIAAVDPQPGSWTQDGSPYGMCTISEVLPKNPEFEFRDSYLAPYGSYLPWGYDVLPQTYIEVTIRKSGVSPPVRQYIRIKPDFSVSSTFSIYNPYLVSAIASKEFVADFTGSGGKPETPAKAFGDIIFDSEDPAGAGTIQKIGYA